MHQGKTPGGTAFCLHGRNQSSTVVLIHGLGLCQALWSDHIGRLAQHYRVVTYDLSGHGESQAAVGPVSLETFGDQFRELMDFLSLSDAAIVGFSIGGMINRHFALTDPERVAALAVLNSPHDRDAAAQQQVEERARKVTSEGASATMAAALERWFTPEFRARRPDVLQLVSDWREQVDFETYAGAAWVLAAGTKDLKGKGDKINAPTLVMTCENDSGSTPSMSHGIAAQIAGARTFIIPRLKHLGLLEDPAGFTTPLIEFLSDTRW